MIERIGLQLDADSSSEEDEEIDEIKPVPIHQGKDGLVSSPDIYDARYPNQLKKEYKEPQDVYGGMLVPTYASDQFRVRCPFREVTASVVDCCCHCRFFYGSPTNDVGRHYAVLCSYLEE